MRHRPHSRKKNSLVRVANIHVDTVQDVHKLHLRSRRVWVSSRVVQFASRHSCVADRPVVVRFPAGPRVRLDRRPSERQRARTKKRRVWVGIIDPSSSNHLLESDTHAALCKLGSSSLSMSPPTPIEVSATADAMASKNLTGLGRAAFFPDGSCVWFQFQITLEEASTRSAWVDQDTQKHIGAWELLAQYALTYCVEATRWLSWYGVGLASADRLPVVVRIPAGPLRSLKCDPPKGNGRRPQKKH